MEKTETRHMLKETEMKKIQDCMPYVFPSIVLEAVEKEVSTTL